LNGSSDFPKPVGTTKKSKPRCMYSIHRTFFGFKPKLWTLFLANTRCSCLNIEIFNNTLVYNCCVLHFLVYINTIAPYIKTKYNYTCMPNYSDLIYDTPK
jgi:hypothetical protein